MRKYNFIKVTALLLVLVILLTACFDGNIPCADGHTYDNACDAECNVCGASRTPAEHSYDNACDAICNECGEGRTPAEHIYDNACDPDCNVCGASHVPSNHAYDNPCDADCNLCGASRTPAEHSYDNDCDASCNACGASRTPASHVYDNACDTSCNECGESRTVGDHVDEGGDGKCDHCGADVAVPPCQHDYDSDCDTTCNKCGEERAAKHTYDNACDASCNVCGADRTPASHVYDNACDADCNVCGESRTVGEHNDGNNDGQCDECGATVESESPENPAVTVPVFDVSQIPEFDNSVEYVPISGNIPNFTKAQITTESYAYYSPLDALGRAGLTVACLGRELFPTKDRGSLPNPTGWHSSSIYERSHLIAHSLAGFDEANNLITGTYDLNGVMQEFEEMVKDYIVETGNHVMYRVIPIFEGNNLVASGVTMEAWSVEDDGEGICFNIYIYNAQDDEIIDYATGDVTLPENNYTFVVNKNNGKIHTADCSNVAGMKDENKIFWEGSYAELISYLNAQGKSHSNAGCCSPQNSTAGQALFTLPEDKYYLV